MPVLIDVTTYWHKTEIISQEKQRELVMQAAKVSIIEEKSSHCHKLLCQSPTGWKFTLALHFPHSTNGKVSIAKFRSSLGFL